MILLVKNFLKILEKNGIDQVEAAKKGGMSPSFLSKVLNHHRDPRYETILKMAKGLEVEPWELFVDYDSGEIGPLNQKEKALVLDYRGVPPEHKEFVELAAKKMKAHKRPPLKD